MLCFVPRLTARHRSVAEPRRRSPDGDRSARRLGRAERPHAACLRSGRSRFEPNPRFSGDEFALIKWFCDFRTVSHGSNRCVK